MDGGPLTTRPISRKARTKRRNRGLPDLDGRTRASRRFRDIVGCLAAELSHEPSQGELGLIRQTSLSIVLGEQLQAKALRGEASVGELGEIARLGNLVTRGLLALGVQRNKPEGPDLKTYLASKPKAAAP